MEGDQGAETARMFLPEDIAKGSSDSVHPLCCLGSTWCGGEKAAFVADQSPVASPAASLWVCVSSSRVLILSGLSSLDCTREGWHLRGRTPCGLWCGPHLEAFTRSSLRAAQRSAPDTFCSLPSPSHFQWSHSLVSPHHTWTCSPDGV